MKDRFGNERCAAYRQEDHELCRCVLKRGDPTTIVREPSPQCPECGGYGEVPIKTKVTS